ncbi:MAG: sigma-70 family RNA polymerase sigma factor [Rhodospirillaceae bacterium]|nr:sigma-70 family RNA polymerase sigma factor [Rhodospirillaceae bacterium]
MTLSGNPAPVAADRAAIAADAALMGRVAGGDPAAARAVVDRHLPGLVAFAWRMVGERATAEDVAQDAMLKLWRQAPRWKPKAQIGTWLRRVAYNRCIDLHRRTRPSEDVTALALEDPSPGPSRRLLAAEVSSIVRQAMEALPERQRAAIAMAHFDGMNNGETAAALEISVEAVESLLARGRRTLRQRLTALKPDLLEEFMP